MTNLALGLAVLVTSSVAIICYVAFRNATYALINELRGYRDSSDKASELLEAAKADLAVETKERDALASQLFVLEEQICDWHPRAKNVWLSLDANRTQMAGLLEELGKWTAAQDEHPEGLTRPPGEDGRTSAETEEQPGLEEWDCTACCATCRLSLRSADSIPAPLPHRCPFADVDKVKWSLIELAGSPVKDDVT